MKRREFLNRSLAAGAFALVTPWRGLGAVGGSGTGSLIRWGGGVCIERASFIMGTVVRITAYASTEQLALTATSMAFREIQRLERLFSVFRTDSDISRVNRVAGDTAVRVHPEVVQLLERAREYSTATGGKVDVTIEPLMRLWGFREEGHGRNCIPTDPEIVRAIDCVGLKNLILDTNASIVGLTKRGASLDLGGIAVGYAVDRAASIIRESGIQSAFINHSGDAYAIGTPPDSDGWEVVIPHPLQPAEPLVRRRLSDRAISTSGNYEKFVLLDGVRWGHIVDPYSGWPGEKFLGMTVIAPAAITADAISTGLFCMNEREMRNALRVTPDIEAISVAASDDDVVISRICSE